MSESAGLDALRHYTCAQSTTDGLIVGNGDHVDAIAVGLNESRLLVEVLHDVEPEPDPPIWTPRIALVLDAEPKMSAVSRSNGEVIREVHSCAQRTGTASVVTTYSGSVHTPVGNAPYFETEETRSLQELCEALFRDHLNDQLRVLLVAGQRRRAPEQRASPRRSRSADNLRGQHGPIDKVPCRSRAYPHLIRQ
jgi:hypothetical protein